VDTKVASSFRWWVLATVIFGTFLGRLDQTIVNLALPKIIDDFNITVTSAGWIATAYILANAVFVPIWGKLGDTIGRKKVYLLGFIIFIIGSVLAGLSWNLSSMIVFRVIQAIAGSADYPTAMAILAVTFDKGKERAQALGIWSASFAVAAVFGPLIGGPLIDAFGWRSVFLINLPVGIIGLAMAWIFVTESVSSKKTESFDWWGALTLGGSLASLVLVLDKGIDWGWTSWESVLCYVATVVFALVFYRIETTHTEPIVDFKFFKIPIFTSTLINNFIVFMSMMGSFFLIPVFAQTFLGYDATQTGYLFIPMAFAIMIAAPLGGSLSGKVSTRNVIMGSTFLSAIGLFMFLGIDVRSSAWDLIIPMVVMAFGIGFGMAQRTNAIAAAVPDSEIGVASSILALARNIAGAFGVALFATILHNATENNLFEIAKQSTLHITNAVQYQEAIILMELKAQVSAYHSVFYAAALVMLFGAITSWWIRVPKHMESHEDIVVE
jgi:DHA2 family multidrug resistance protein